MIKELLELEAESADMTRIIYPCFRTGPYPTPFSPRIRTKLVSVVTLIPFQTHGYRMENILRQVSDGDL